MLDVTRFAFGFAALTALAAAPALADAPQGFLETIHHHGTLGSTVPDNGDLNPYAIVVAPASAGMIHQHDVLIDNFNNQSNLQGTGTTIMVYSPATKKTSLFAKLPQKLEGCPGGIGLTTAMTMLKAGWVIVGSTPSTDGTTKTRGSGCLIVLDANGKVAGTITGPNINGPWGNIATIDDGVHATLFISMAGTVPGPDVKAAGGDDPVVIRKATVLRLELETAGGKPPTVTGQTVIASGLGARADKAAFMVGPTGIMLSPGGKTLYVSDSVDNRIVAIADPATRSDSAGTGRVITKDGLMKRPLAMAAAPNGHLLICNALNGQVVEVDPLNGNQIYAQWIDTDQAQSPPGNGDLFGIVMMPDGKGFYYVEDDVNTVMEAR
jgi:DNA-binding beta-propeller fold protein YncE